MDPLDAITHAAVRAALRQLAADRTPCDSPLCRLAIVRRSLRRAGYQPTAEACGFEIGRLLTEIVEAELARLRRRAGTRVSGPPPDERAVLRADFAAGFHELEAWSALYHVYLRPDLGVDLSALAACIDDRHRRTLQRRLRHGVEALAVRLRALEHDALSAARDARVRAHLPAPESSRLFGVDGLVNRLAGALIDGGGRPVAALGGAGGIGKTAVARAVAERCLLSGAFDAVLWVDAPACGLPGVIAVLRPETVRPREAAAIADWVPAAGAPPAASVRAESLGRPAGGDRRVAEPPGAAHDLAFGTRATNTVRAGAYPAGDDARNGAAGPPTTRRLLGLGTDADASSWLSEDGVAAGASSRLVVVDGVDDPALARAVVAAAHGARGATQVLLTGRVGWWRLTGVRVTQVPPLPPGPALDLLRHAAAERGLEALADASAEELGPLVAATAGHPLAIQAAVGELCADDAAGVAAAFAATRGAAAELCDRLWAPIWDGVDAGARAAVRAILAGRDEGGDVAAVQRAVDAGLLIPCGAGRRRFRCPPFLRRFLARRSGGA